MTYKSQKTWDITAKIAAALSVVSVSVCTAHAKEKKPLLSSKVSAASQKKHSDKSTKPDSEFPDEDSHPWMQSVPLNKTSAHGLPLGLLNHAVLKESSSQVRQLLMRAPRHAGDEEERAMWKSTALALDKRFEQAHDEFAKLKNWRDFPASVKTEMARCYAEEQDFKQAIVIYSSVVAEDPSPKAYSGRAGCYSSLNKFLEAAHDYGSASKLDEWDERRLLTQGANLLVKLGRTKEAMAYIERAEKSPRERPSPALYMVKAECYTKDGNREKAVEAFNQAEAALAGGTSRFGSDTDVLLPTILRARANLYKSMGKTDLERKDRAKLDKMTNSLIDEVGDKQDRAMLHK